MPKNANVVTGKWVRNWKTDDRGNVIKPKSRMIARGFDEIHDVDFSETFFLLLLLLLLLLPHQSAASVKIAVAVLIVNEKDYCCGT